VDLRPGEVNEFFFFLNYQILSATLGPGVRSASNINEYQKQKNVSRGKVWLVRKADNLATICEPMV
jgi:hypothetical protein